MSSPAELLRLGLLALLTGIAIPLLVQLFLVLRNVQKVTGTLDRRLEQTLRTLDEVIADTKRGGVATPTLATQIVAAVPAMIAAVRAFRSGLAHEDSATAPSNTTNNQEKHA